MTVSEEMVLAGAKALHEAWRTAVVLPAESHDGMWENLHHKDRESYLRTSGTALTAALSDLVPPATISDTAENIARSFAQYCLEHDILTMHGMKGLRERVEVIIANFKQRIDDLENTIDLADKHTAFLMTKLDPPASTSGEVGK